MTKLIWHGDEIFRMIEKSSEKGVNKVMAESVISAKQSHPGWKNRTGTAEGSVRIVKFSEKKGTTVSGTWGSADVAYTWWLELKHGSFLRMSASRNYGNLGKYIHRAWLLF